jgi:hypothetical protein
VLRFRLMVKRGRGCGLKHQKEKRSMEYFAGLDVSVKDTSVCIVDETGKIAREVKVTSEPEALLASVRAACGRSNRAQQFATGRFAARKRAARGLLPFYRQVIRSSQWPKRRVISTRRIGFFGNVPGTSLS